MPILQMRRLKFHELKSHNKDMNSCQQLLGTYYALGRSLTLYLCHLIESHFSCVGAGLLPTLYKLVN